MINKKWDWAGKILEQLPTRLVKVERQLITIKETYPITPFVISGTGRRTAH